MRLSGVILACALVAGCQSTSSIAPPPVFDPQAAQFIRERGTSRIEGQAVFVTRDGKAHALAGETIRLVPATPYTIARFEALYRGRTSIPAMWMPSVEAGRIYTSYTRRTKTRSDATFAFDRVAPGTYFVTTQYIYTAKGSFTPEGAAMYAKVTIGTGQSKASVAVIGYEEGRF